MSNNQKLINELKLQSDFALAHHELCEKTIKKLQSLDLTGKCYKVDDEHYMKVTNVKRFSDGWYHIRVLKFCLYTENGRRDFNQLYISSTTDMSYNLDKYIENFTEISEEEFIEAYSKFSEILYNKFISKL